MNKLFLAATVATLLATPALACGGTAEPVEVTFAGHRIDLTGPAIEEGNILDGILVEEVRPLIVNPENASQVHLITLRHGEEAHTYQVVYPPVSRGLSGCNQPYLSE